MSKPDWKDAPDDEPDLIIPNDAVELLSADLYLEQLVEMGYGVVFDKDGIRGWKEA